MSDSVLYTEGLTVRFGGLTAVNNVTLDCSRGELTGLIGPNGAGKTTFVDAVTGFLPGNSSGSVQIEGTEVFGRSAHLLAHAGLSRTWQTLELFDDISVRSNLDVASRVLTVRGAVRDFFRASERDDRVEEILELLGLADIANRQPVELSQGQRKLVGVGRALVASSTKILLLDEPAAGLDRTETAWFGEQLRGLVDEGYTMLLIDHDMGLVLNVCDRIHMLVFGELVTSGTPEEMRGNPDVIAAYLGHSGDSSNG
ncbi:MAG TPA: ABC transporter ATP-binding protein [Gemmatimonadetes bacterium]|jgi:ABC-type branched-subunit amino acid transport system ATPase component|nr:ABC transporter ATP-binding protein [Chloroflexota bacterium]HAT17165.1 ABC transporter ATP-binding protein [Gemmatimonadota bacterium]|tara:strand:- start:4141 stop:4908 length:768 start_codon:yes stop_codon:yes gene_type:complete